MKKKGKSARRKLTRAGGALLKAKAAKRASRPGRKKKAPQVVFRNSAGKFAKRSARERQSVQVIGRKGFAEARKRSREELAEAISEIGRPSERVYAADTISGTMADRILNVVSVDTGQPLAIAFSEGLQSGVISVQGGELSFSLFFHKLDLQELLAQALSSYFERAHAVRERVSAKARIGKGHHRNYKQHRSVRVVVRLE